MKIMILVSLIITVLLLFLIGQSVYFHEYMLYSVFVFLCGVVVGGMWFSTASLWIMKQ